MLVEDKLIQDAGFYLMDEAELKIRSGKVSAGLDLVVLGLKNIKQGFSQEAWRKFSKTTFLKHPLVKLIHQCPFTYHAFSKPRGYAGDAELIDFIYGLKTLPNSMTEIGREILFHRINSSVVKSVQMRRDIVASTIDSVASKSDHPIQILSVACGHLRETQKSNAFESNLIRKFYALDKDPLSIRLINQELANYPIRTINSSVANLIREKIQFSNLDLVYATGLYDYLTQKFASRLTKIMFDMLCSGGRVLVTNFVPNHLEVGYMETFMDWNLNYRTEKALEAVSIEIPSKQIAYKRTFFEKNNNIVFLELVKN